MKKNNLVLLTVLIMLVIYCGIVIFVTKPSDFAYEALFGDAGQSSKAPEAEAPAVDRAELTADMEAIASRYADKAVDQAARNADAAIRDAIGKIDIDTTSGTVDVAAIVRTTVADAIAEAKDGIVKEAAALAAASVLSGRDEIVKEVYDRISSDLLSGGDEVVKEVYDKISADLLSGRDAIVSEITDKVTGNVTDSITDKVAATVTSSVTGNLLSRKDSVVQEVSDKVTAEILSREDEVIAAVTDNILSHEDELVDRVTQTVLDRLKANLLSALKELEAEAKAASEAAAGKDSGTAEEDDYETVRRKTREAEIRKLLDQLQD